ncbi:Ama1 protein [Trypanosoma conorhini]|uniref:Ama1 protein n=1 Tax=Trypanosoma conorhini TaxID=83891 RepID=A0A3R7NMD8_9TRYP|nr:Ama1 protein [Trypanosoma conorhini]RNF24093.1 Ama1 protein [Trypanosoma conorhini]
MYPVAYQEKLGTGPEVMGVPMANQFYYPPPPPPPPPPQLMPQTAPVHQFPLRDWRYGICHCCQDCSPCLEAWCCFYCQLSRQYSMLCQRQEPGIDWLIAFGACLGDYCCGGLVSPVLQCVARTRLRTDLNIRGSNCCDFCSAFCCPQCTLQQSLMEMTVTGRFPGACCYDVPPGFVAMQ